MVIGVALVIFMASDYIFPPEDTAPATNQQPVAEAPAPAPKPAEPAVEAPVETPKTETTQDSPVEVSSTDTPVATDPTLTEPPVTEPVITEPTPTEPVVTTPSETPTESVLTETTITGPTPTEPETTPTIEEPVITDTPIQVDQPSEDSIDGETTSKGDDTLTEQILKDLENQTKKETPKAVKKEYVSPPDYEYKGRGLVYNCAGKHWACVDAPSYKSCEDNNSSTKYLKKPLECYPFNVYQSTKDCEGQQNRMVSSSAKTAFCSE